MCGENHMEDGSQSIGFATVALHLLTVLCVCEFLAKSKLLAAYPPCFPDLVPHEFLLFQELKMVFKRKEI
jgi:hypothetical protein